MASLRLMSQQLTRGPLPASVYWRRRFAAVLVLVTVVSLFSAAVRLVTGGDDEIEPVEECSCTAGGPDPACCQRGRH